MKFRSFVAMLMFVAAPLLAQSTTGTISGKVVAEDGTAMPGVVVTAESPNLQGTRSTVSEQNGQFLFKLLPPGDYTLTVVMAGMQTQKQPVKVSINSTSRPRFVLQPMMSEETLTVVASSVMEVDSTTVSSVFENEFVEELPRARNFNSIAALTPGVTASVNGGISVSGATSADNTYMINGALANFDYIRASGSNDLYVEDDIQETQVLTGNVSAEFGNFTGGIVNTITKSGGNDFHGTFRVEFRQDDWTARTPLQLEGDTELQDELNQIYTMTFNGPIIKDRLWFAISARQRELDGTANTLAMTPMPDSIATALGYPTGQQGIPSIALPQTTEQDRIQLKLTGQIYEGHTVIVSYLDDNNETLNIANPGPGLSPSGFADANSFPEELLTVAYNGLITSSFSVDFNYAERKGSIQSLGGESDLLGGTVVRVMGQGSFYGGYTNAPFGNSNDPAQRDSENWNLKFSYFHVNDTAGSHDITFGVQSQSLLLQENNSQSTSNWTVFAPWARAGANNEYIPIYAPGGNVSPVGQPMFAIYWPVLNPSQGSDFTTEALYVNDIWMLNDKWSFNVGLRFDRNDTKAQDGQQLSETDNISPRLQVNYDVNGDGVHQLSAGYNQYVGALNAQAADGEVAGNVSYFAYFYGGPVTESLQEVFDWYDSNIPGGLANIGPENADSYDPNQVPFLWFADFALAATPDQLTTVPDPDGLDSQSVVEYTLGYRYRFNDGRGYIRGDLVMRDYQDFLVTKTNLSTGQNANGLDRSILTNDSSGMERTYEALMIQGQYDINQAFGFGGNYTLSKNEGNYLGYGAGGGAFVPATQFDYPEYTHPQTNVVGRMGDDSRHSLRLWANYDLDTVIGGFAFSLMQTYISGTPYGIAPSFNISGDPTAWGFPAYDSLPYNSPPQTVTYTVGEGDQFEWDDVIATDLAVNYSFDFKRFQLFAKAMVQNVFNNDAVIGGNANISATGVPFNMQTETPQEGVHYNLDPNFGQPQAAVGDFQLARRLRIDVGIRF